VQYGLFIFTRWNSVKDSEKMAKTTSVEISCDYCGCADHINAGGHDKYFKSVGWLYVGRKHFCDSTCFEKFDKK
jgi:hypothetical protein